MWITVVCQLLVQSQSFEGGEKTMEEFRDGNENDIKKQLGRYFGYDEIAKLLAEHLGTPLGIKIVRALPGFREPHYCKHLC